VHVFEEGVRSHDHFGTRARAQDCRVISDPNRQTLPRDWKSATYPFDQFFLTGHKYSCRIQICVVS
jgi:hypothetical protein